MARRIVGEVVRIEEVRMKRDQIKFKKLELRSDEGEAIIFEDISAERPVAELIQPGARGVFYASKLWSQIYGFRPEGGEGVFRAFVAHALVLLFCIGLIVGGFATTMFVFGFFVGCVGVLGVFICLDARNARAKFKRDERALRKAQKAALAGPARRQAP